MYKFLTKNGQAFAFGLGVLLSAIFLMMVFGGLEEFNLLSKDDQKATNIFNFGIQVSILLTILCAAIALLFGVYQLATNFKGSLMGIVGIVALLAIFFIAYSTSAVEESGAVFRAMQKFNISSGESKFISGAITTGLAMAAIAGIAFVLSEVRNFFK